MSAAPNFAEAALCCATQQRARLNAWCEAERREASCRLGFLQEAGCFQKTSG